jgi:prepilin signal peptidase PulO-like enzyme (type II secretory pathway)
VAGDLRVAVLRPGGTRPRGSPWTPGSSRDGDLHVRRPGLPDHPDEVSLSGILIGLSAASLSRSSIPADCRTFRRGRGFRRACATGLFAVAGASAVGAVVGGGTIYVGRRSGKILFRKRVEAAGEDTAMGLGDVKFMGMAGAVLGWRGVLCTLMVACLCGAIFGVGRVIVTRRMGFVPFGPFLAIGALTLLFVPEASTRRSPPT